LIPVGIARPYPLIPNCVKADSLWDSQSAKSLNLWVQIWEDVAWV
jgi:hypothetical protein